MIKTQNVSVKASLPIVPPNRQAGAQPLKSLEQEAPDYTPVGGMTEDCCPFTMEEAKATEEFNLDFVPYIEGAEASEDDYDSENIYSEELEYAQHLDEADASIGRCSKP